MMTIIEAIEKRHSVRKYLDKKIEAEKVALLNEKIAALNAEGNINLCLLEDAGSTFGKILARAMGLSSAPSAIICTGPDDETVDQRVGYYGEQLVLYAQMLGLNTCWVGMSNKKAYEGKLKDGEKYVIAIAIGYGENQGREGRKSKTQAEVTSGDKDTPEWFNYGVELALKAPTAVNQQKFDIAYNNGEVTFTDKGGTLSGIDLGIVKYHFEVGAKHVKGEN